MNDSWPLPDAQFTAENHAVIISGIDPEADVPALYAAASLEANGTDLFEYHLNIPPMTSQALYREYLAKKLSSGSERVYKIYSKRLNAIAGCASLMNIRAAHGSVEVGSIWLNVSAQRSEILTSAMDILFSYVFDDLGYRRLEWKCNDKNLASRMAAERLGFHSEGHFRNHFVSRGESRDTSWYSLIDSDWSTGAAEHIHSLAAKPYTPA